MSQTLASGITGAAPIWHSIMTNLLAKYPETPPSIPSDVVVRMCFGHEEYFLSGTDKNVPCSPQAFTSTSNGTSDQSNASAMNQSGNTKSTN